MLIAVFELGWRATHSFPTEFWSNKYVP